MSDIKIPVSWLKEKGIEPAVGDGLYTKKTDSKFNITQDQIDNLWIHHEGYLFITSFADRECTGKQPVPDWVPLDVSWYTNGYEACQYVWDGDHKGKWKPNIDKLYEIYLSEQESGKMIENNTDNLQPHQSWDGKAKIKYLNKKPLKQITIGSTRLICINAKLHAHTVGLGYLVTAFNDGFYEIDSDYKRRAKDHIGKGKWSKIGVMCSFMIPNSDKIIVGVPDVKRQVENAWEIPPEVKVINWDDHPVDVEFYSNRCYYKMVDGLPHYWCNKESEWFPSYSTINELKRFPDYKIKSFNHEIDEPTIYTKEMHDNGRLPPIGCECEVIGREDDNYYKCEIILHRKIDGKYVAVFLIKNYLDIEYYYSHCFAGHFKPIETKTDKEEVIWELTKYLSENFGIDLESIPEEIYNRFIKTDQ